MATFAGNPPASALNGTEIVPISQSGTDKRTTVQGIADANESKSTDIASAATTDLSTATTPFVHVTGTTTITALGTVQAGAERQVVFDGILTLTHDGTALILPTGADITTAAGDAAIFRSEGSGNWRCVAYQRADGTPLAGGGGGGGSVAGSDKQIQYNNSGAFGAEAGFEYDASTNTLTVSNITTTGLLNTAASATGGSGFRLPHGAAPTSPVDGDVWTTSAGGMYVRINGVTVGPLAASGGGGLTGFTASLETASPNNTINASKMAASGGTTSQDLVIQPKGVSGSILAQTPDNASTGGNKRGAKAVDLQLARGSATQVASGSNATIAGGSNNTASGDSSFAVGSGNTASGNFGVAIGNSNAADAASSMATGDNGKTFGVINSRAHGGTIFGGGVAGSAQFQEYPLHVTTTNATPTALTTNGGAAAATNQPFIPGSFSAHTVTGHVVAYQKATGDSAHWTFSFGMVRNGAASTTAMVGTPTVTLVGASAGAATWALGITADTTNGAASIKATGVAATTIDWDGYAVSAQINSR